MPIEVEKDSYYFLEGSLQPVPHFGPQEIQSQESTEPVAPGFKCAFRYNPLHDFESWWWIGVYFVVNRRVVTFKGLPVSNTADREDKQKALAVSLFNSLSDRIDALRGRNPKGHVTFLQSLQNCLLPGAEMCGRPSELKGRDGDHGGFPPNIRRSIKTLVHSHDLPSQN